MGWRVVRLHVKEGIALSHPRELPHLPGVPHNYTMTQKKLSKISILLLYRIRHKVKIFYFVIFYFPDYFCHYKHVSKYKLLKVIKNDYKTQT